MINENRYGFSTFIDWMKKVLFICICGGIAACGSLPGSSEKPVDALDSDKMHANDDAKLPLNVMESPMELWIWIAPSARQGLKLHSGEFVLESVSVVP